MVTQVFIFALILADASAISDKGNKKNGILFLKLFWPSVRKKCSNDREKLLKFKAEGWEFSFFFKSLGQFFQRVKVTY